MTIKQAIKLVEDHLKDHPGKTKYGLHIVDEASQKDGDWFYICVQPDNLNIRAYDYYDLLSQIEQEIEAKNKDVNILIVPVAAEAA